MNAEIFIDRFDQLVIRIYRYQDSHESIGNIKDKIYEFLDQNYDTYLRSSPEERKKIRDLVKKHHTSTESPKMLVLFLIGYVQMAAKNIKLSNDRTWLLRGLVVSSIENCLLDQRDNTFSVISLCNGGREKLKSKT